MTSKPFDEWSWQPCDSRSDLVARLEKAKGKVFQTLADKEANAWGYAAQDGEFIPIGYADLGLTPVVVAWRETVFVGSGGTLTALDAKTGQPVFSYVMPTVFHEFLRIEDGLLLARDEIGFVALSLQGQEKWKALCGDIVEDYEIQGEIDGAVITGRTMEGSNFRFVVEMV